MRVEIIAPESGRADEEVALRAVLFNDSFEPVEISRNAFIGPNVVAVTAQGFPHPDAVEPTFGQDEELVSLQPFAFYGRERSYDSLGPGEVEVTAFYRPDGQPEIRASTRMRIEG